MMWRRRGTRAGEGAGGEGEEEETYRRRRVPSPLATPSGRPHLWRSGGRPEQREARLWKKGNASWRGRRRGRRGGGGLLAAAPPVSAGGGVPCRRWSGGAEGLLAPAQALEGRGVGDGERKNEPVLCNEWQKRVITFQLHIQVQNEKVWSCAEEVLQNSKPICTTAPEFGLLHGVLELGCLAAKLVGVGGVEL